MPMLAVRGIATTVMDEVLIRNRRLSDVVRRSEQRGDVANKNEG
jgi:hypothetical protein